MNQTELVKYLNERKSSIENQISRAKTEIKNLEGLKIKNIENTSKVKDTEDISLVVDVGKKYDLNLNDNLMFLKLSKVILMDKIEENKNLIDDKIKEIKKEIVFKKSDLDSINTCPICGGMGQRIEVEYIRQGGKVTPVRHVIKCKACNGDGKIPF